MNRDHILFHEGDKADKVYIVQSGEFVVTKNIKSEQQKEENIRQIKEDPRRACKLSNKLFNKNIIKNVDKHVIAYVGKGNIIGIDDVRKPEEPDEFDTYKTSVKCITKEAELMFLYKKDFMVLKQQQTTWNSLV